MMLHPYSTAGCTFVSQERLPVLQVPTQQPSHSPTQFSAGPLQEVQSQPLQSTTALSTALKHFAFVSMLVRGDCLTKINVKQNKKLVFKYTTMCSKWKLYWALWKFLEFINGCSSSVWSISFESWTFSILGHYYTKSRGINSISFHSIQI